MKKEIRYSGVLRVFLLFFMGLLLQFNNVTLAQNTTEKGAQISDESAPNALTPITFSILELSSKERGFLMPRMTTVERMRIPTANLSGGMVIFNTTLDCVEFYNASRQQWMNICGGNDPAVYTIPVLKCGTAKASGTYTAGVLLDERKNIITIEVSVSSPGSFDIEAIAYDDTTQLNGYTFSAHGTFPTEGSFVIVLRGKGTPKKGYAAGAGKDKIKFFLNKKLVTCEISNDVAKDFEPLVANLLCTDVTNKINVEGTYKEKVPLTAANKITVPVKVTKSGRGKVYGKVEKTTTQTENVLYESDVTDFVVTPSNGVQWVVLKPAVNTGKPTTGGNMKVDLKIVSKGKNEYDPFVPADPKDISTCSFNINVESDGVKFNLNRINLQTNFFSNIGGNFYVTPRTNMGGSGSDAFSIIARVTPKSAGEYVLESNTKNGIYFKGSQIITQAQVTAGSEVSITLKAYGISKTDLKITDPEAYFTVTTNNVDVGLVSTKSLAVDFVYRPMNLYSIGDQAWHPGGAYSTTGTYDGGPALVQNSTHFGWNGVVRVDGLNFIAGLGVDTSNHITSTATSNVNTFKGYVDRADIIVIGGNTAGSNLRIKRPEQMDYLFDWTKNSGALIFGEGDGTVLKGFMDRFESGNTIGTQPSGTYLTSGSKMSFELLVQSQNAKKIIGTSDTYFSKYYSFKVSGGLQAKLIGTQNNTTTSTVLSSIGSNFETIATTPGLGTFAFVHKSYGFAGIASATFMGGTRKDISNDNNYPCRSDLNGELLTAPYTGGPVYNSLFLLNLVYWAIDYAQEHQPNEIKP